jgi:hypothetical protein
VRRSRGLRAGLCLATLAALVGCGGHAEPPSRPAAKAWRFARLRGVASPSGLALLGSRIAISGGGGDRVVHVLDTASLEDGRSVAVEDLPVTIDRDVHLGGSEPFAARGYQLGDLWDDQVDFEGIALQAPAHITLAERRYRVAWVGEVEADASGAWKTVHLKRAFAIPGAQRSPTWLDQSAGIAGLDVGRTPESSQDLVAVEREGAVPGTFRIARVDRVAGSLRLVVVVRVPGGEPADVGGILAGPDGFQVLRGPGRGEIVDVSAAPSPRPVEAARGEPGPDLAGSSAWTGIARGADGTLYLVSGGPDPVLAWRVP